MDIKTISNRDKLFWTSAGFGSILFIYFLFNFFKAKDSDYTNFYTAAYKNEIEIKIPKYLQKTDSLNKKAILQFKDLSNEVFLFVLEEKKTGLAAMGITPTLAEYYAYLKMVNADVFNGTKVSSEKSNTINGLKTLTCELSGKYAGREIFYIFTVFESKDAFYQVTAYTTDAVKHAVKKDMYASIHSFKKLK